MSTKDRFAQLVVVGSSAGGIEALSRLVSTLPADFPAPIVIAQHLSPHTTSHLKAILGGHSTLPVETVTDRLPLSAGRIYVVPSNQDVVISDHDVRLQSPGSGSKPSIDMLLSSAAERFGDDLIAVVLTGTGSDGAVGAQEVKRLGGTVVIQDPRSAKYPALPLSLAPTVVDLSLEIDEIGPKLHGLLTRVPVEGKEDGDVLDGLLKVVQEHSGINFSNYKRPTILRRLHRRMVATNNETIGDYMKYLQATPAEYRALVDNFLIKVTEFFRDAELFTYLREQLLPAVVAEARRSDGEIRIWSAGCATGEEAYSVAILLMESLGDELDDFHVRIFATDLDSDSVDFGRRGIYPISAMKHMPEEFLAKYFTFNGGEYQIRKNIRNLTVFGQHDLAQRPPFQRIDLLLCRNVLIYFAPDLQRRALGLCAFSLRHGGYLALGKAESAGSLPEYFSIENPHLKIFRCREDRPSRVPTGRFRDGAEVSFSPRAWTNPKISTDGKSPAGQTLELDIPGKTTSKPVENESPWTPAFWHLPVGIVVVDRQYDIEFLNLAARRLLGVLGPAVGEDLVYLVKHSSRELRQAIERVFRNREEAVLENVSYADPTKAEPRSLRVSCFPYESESPRTMGQYVVVVVEDVSQYRQEILATQSGLTEQSEERERIRQQLDALTAVTQELRTANEDLTSENMELRSTNQEFLVGSEEQQAGTEEIETLNEELQASNEELETLNEELQATVEELNATNDDLHARSNELQDLTESLEIARGSSESERARLGAILAGMGDAVIVVDKHDNLLLTNQSFHNLFGDYTEDFVRTDADGQPVKDRDRPRKRAARGESFSIEYTGARDDGTRAYYEIIGRPIGTGEDFQAGVLVIRDITDRSLRKLQDEFIAIAGHELRTPLTVLRGYLQLLSRPSYDPDQRTQFLSMATEQATRMERLIYDLLDVVRLQSGHLSLRKSRVDLVDILAHDVAVASQLSPDRSVSFRRPTVSLEMDGDPERLEQVFLNLLFNATQYTPPGSEVTVRARRVRDYAEVNVKDSGPGIDEVDLPHIFSRFFRSRDEAAGRQSGLGLGLYISRELVNAHGGRIHVASEPGKGTTFTVRLALTVNSDSKERSDGGQEEMRPTGKPAKKGQAQEPTGGAKPCSWRATPGGE